MPTVAIKSIVALSKCPIDAFAVEKPPVAIVVIPCAIDSKPFIPARKYEPAQRPVRKR